MVDVHGNIYPVATGGKVFTFIGLAIVAVPAGIIASSLMAVKKQGD